MIVLSGGVGQGGENLPYDRAAVALALRQAGFKADENALEPVIRAFQAIFFARPDGLISPEGPSARFLGRWSEKPLAPGVVMTPALLRAWRRLSPILPAGAYCSSGMRTAEAQRRLIVDAFIGAWRDRLIARFGAGAHARVLAIADQAERDRAMHRALNAAGFLVALPGASRHQHGRAFDIGGPDDEEQLRTARMVARANPKLFTGKVIAERRQGCVHVEIY